MGMVKWAGERGCVCVWWGVAMFMPLVSGKGYKGITPCATFGLCKSPGVQELKGWWWLEIQFGLPLINATKTDRTAAHIPSLQTRLGWCLMGFTPFFHALLIKRPSCPCTYLFMNLGFDRCWGPLISPLISPSLMALLPDDPYNINPDWRPPPAHSVYAHSDP